VCGSVPVLVRRTSLLGSLGECVDKRRDELRCRCLAVVDLAGARACMATPG